MLEEFIKRQFAIRDAALSEAKSQSPQTDFQQTQRGL